MVYVPAKPVVLAPKTVICVLADTPVAFMIVPTTNLPYMTLLTVSVVPEICPTKATPGISRGGPPFIDTGAAELPIVCALLT
jgi:hypothetical protein